MKFIKGMIMGTVISASVWMLCSEETKCTRNKFMKQGKKFMKSMGMMWNKNDARPIKYGIVSF